MIGRRALFASAFALVAVGAAVGLSSSDSTTRSTDGGSTGKPGAVEAARSILENALLTVGAAVGRSNSDISTLAGASAVGAAPAEAGETRSADGPAASPAGKPAAVAAAQSTIENAPTAVGNAVGLSGSDSTTRSSTPAGASAVNAAPAEAGETRNADGSAAGPAGKPAAVAAASSIVENDKQATETTGASPSGGDGSGERRATRSVDLQARPGTEPARSKTGAPPKTKREGHGLNAPRFVAHARSLKPAASVARSPGFAAQRQRDARPVAAQATGAPQLVHAVSPARVIDEAGFLR